MMRVMNLVETTTGKNKNFVTLPLDADAESVVPPDRQPLVCASEHVEADLADGRWDAEDVSGGRDFFFFSGGPSASLLPVAILVVALGAAFVFTVVHARKSWSQPLSQSGTSHGAAAVCVLGQLSRLEIESKMQNIIKPLSNFTKVDVFLSLEIGSHAIFFNPATADVAGTRCHDSKLDADGVKKAFAPYFRDGVFGPHVVENVILDRWPRLYTEKHLRTDCNDANHCDQRRNTIAHVVSQMRHQKDCAELIQKSEESGGGRYDIVVKVRDNTIALRPVVPDKLFAIKEVTLKHCNWWGGVHDKVMVLPRKYLENSLGAVYPYMLAVMHDNPMNHTFLQLQHSSNTEQIVLFTLLANKVPFDQRQFEIGDRDGDDYLPFVDGRCYPSEEPGGEARWCIVSHCKDCWPSMPWTYNVTCEIAVTGQEAPASWSGGQDAVTKPDMGNTSFEQTLAHPDPLRLCLKPIYR
jgi:hypothetical protein